jgi:phosphoribosylformylglycinamidine synthase
MVAALNRAGITDTRLVWHKDTNLDGVDLIALPGGFSYGDYLRCGAMAVQSPVMREVVAQAKRGVHVLGVCNGFQILVESGLLPGALLRNSSLRFICKQVHLKTVTTDSPFTSLLKHHHIIRVPIAHGEGNYFAAPDTIRELEDSDRIAFRYCNENGTLSALDNPNGSIDNIAGILNRERNVLGMMPHPENATCPHQGTQDGLPLFESILRTLS